MRWTDVRGWFSEDEGRALQTLCAGRDVLELGTFAGRSALCAAEVARSVTCVDHFRGDASTGPADTLDEFRANVRACGARNVFWYVSKVESAPDYILVPRGFGAVFFDTAHDADSAERDARIALRCVKPGGVIAWHDCHYPEVIEGAKRAGLVARKSVGSLGWATIGAD